MTICYALLDHQLDAPSARPAGASVDAAKLRMRIDGGMADAEIDTMLESYINAAWALVENHCSMLWGERDLTLLVAVDAAPVKVPAAGVWRPRASVARTSVTRTDDGRQLAGEDLVPDVLGRVALDERGIWSLVGRVGSAAEEAPAGVVEAIMLVASWMYDIGHGGGDVSMAGVLHRSGAAEHLRQFKHRTL